MTNKRLATALLISLTQTIACGSNTDSGGSAGASNVAGNSAGGSLGGAANVAGNSAGGSSAGASNVAGSAPGGSGGMTNVAGSGGAAGSSNGQSPSGTVSTCLGAGCPYGQCNDSSTTTCTSVYPGEIGPSAPLCKADGQYCLGIGSSSDYHSWAIQCTGTTATATACAGNCVYVNVNKTAQCPID